MKVLWYVGELFLIFLFVFLIVSFLRMIKASRYQKRFEKFSLISVTEEERSFSDVLAMKIKTVLQWLSSSLRKSEVLRKFSVRYEKYIAFEEKEQKTGMDYIAIKFFSAFFFFLLYLFTILIQADFGRFWGFGIALVIGFFFPDVFWMIQFQKKKKQVDDDLLKAIIIMNNAFQSGRTIMQAVEIVKNELDGPIQDEFKKIHMDMTYGLSVEVVFDRFYERVKSEDAKYIATSLTLLNRTGGNIVNVFSSIERSFFNKKKLMNEMKSLTSASVFVFRVLVVLPFLFSFVIFVMNPNYFQPFFETPFGFLLFLLILILYVFYIFLIRKVLEVKIP